MSASSSISKYDETYMKTLQRQAWYKENAAATSSSSILQPGHSGQSFLTNRSMSSLPSSSSSTTTTTTMTTTTPASLSTVPSTPMIPRCSHEGSGEIPPMFLPQYSQVSVSVMESASVLASLTQQVGQISQRLANMNQLSTLNDVRQLADVKQLLTQVPNNVNSFDHWIAIHTCYFHIVLVRGWKKMYGSCTTTTCPRMTCGNKEFMWHREVVCSPDGEGAAGERRPFVCFAAPSYTSNVINDFDRLLATLKLHHIVAYHLAPQQTTPATIDVPSPLSRVTDLLDIMKLTLRVYAHLYYRHIGHMASINPQQLPAGVTPQAVPGLLMKFHFQFQYFVLFVEKHQLVDAKQLDLASGAEQRLQLFLQKLQALQAPITPASSSALTSVPPKPSKQEYSKSQRDVDEDDDDEKDDNEEDEDDDDDDEGFVVV